MENKQNKQFNRMYPKKDEQDSRLKRKSPISQNEITALKKLIKKDKKALWNYLQKHEK